LGRGNEIHPVGLALKTTGGFVPSVRQGGPVK